MKKQRCRFDVNCKFFKAGQECKFAHDRCQFGDSCKDKEACRFYHDESEGLPSRRESSFVPIDKREFTRPKSEVQCKFGQKCNKLAEGNCPFKHSQSGARDPPAGKKFDKPINEQLCKFGDRCNKLAMGKCPFKHESNSVASFPASNPVNQRERERENKSAEFQQIFTNLCTDFLHNQAEHPNCGRLHEYSLAKNIKKVFQIDGTRIAKCLVFHPYTADEQPIYAILNEGRISFGQLLNLAKQCGMEHINNSTMVFKRCYNKDIAFQNEAIRDFHLTFTLSSEYPRIDIMIIEGERTIHAALINKGVIHTLAPSKSTTGVIFLNETLIISCQDRTKQFFKFDPRSLSFTQIPFSIPHNLSSCRTYHKKIFETEIAACISGEKTICFLNDKLQTHIVEMEEKVKDIFISEFQGCPVAFALTERQLFAISLLTFQKKSVIEGGMANGLTFSSMKHTFNHLFIAIDNWGILIYNTNNFECPVGVLTLGQRQWHLQGDDRGNLSLISHQTTGHPSWWIFKIRRQ